MHYLFTELGLNLLLISYLPGIIFFRDILRYNVPTKILGEGYGKVVVGKAVFAILLSIISAAEPVGPAKPLVVLLANVGQGYFIASMIIDLIFIAILYKMEYFGAFRIVALNLLHIPFITSAGVLYAVLWEQRKVLMRVWRDLRSSHGVLLGHAIWVVRHVKKPLTHPNDVNIRESYDIRQLPAPVPFRYSPNMRDNNLNNHLIIAGASGAGKTTTIINLIKGLAGKYIVFVVDVKGDITQSLLNSNIRSYIVYVADVGVKVFDRLHEKERNKEIMEDLINSISVVEKVGSRQAHFLRRALIEVETSGQTPTYRGLLQIFRRLVTESLSPDSRLGPGTRDALIGIASKLEDLEEYFKDEGVSISKIVGKIVEDGQKQAYHVIVFNIEGMSETLRAVLLEFILRRLERFLSRRGPFAYLTEKTAVLIVDEAYLVTQPFRRFGGKDERSGSILETISRAGRSYGVALVLVTQRLCDISDGIRQNCERWVVFNTSSPEDARLLSIEGELLTKLIPHLEKGYAYIRKPRMAGFEEIRYNAGVYMVTEGYIFEIARQPIQPNSSHKIEKTICYRCKLVTRDENICSFCNMPPLLQKDNGGNHPDGSGHEIQNLANSVRIDYEAVLKLALGKNSKYTKYLTNISVEHVKKFVSYIISRNDSKVDHELIDVGLLKYSGDGRVRLRPAGKLLHETLIELYGPDLLRRGLSGNNQQG
jgi:general stress protein CsbA